MGRIVLIVVLMFALVLPSTVYAEDASVLLRMYGVNHVLSAEEEKKKLSLVEEEFFEVARVVNSNTMLGLASEVLDEYTQGKLVEIDNEIYQLSDKLSNVEKSMAESAESDVKTILALDSEYRSLQSLLDKKIKDRAEWVEQSQVGKTVVVPTEDADKERLASLTEEVDSQRKKYQKATTYPELGDITNFRSPLSRDPYITSAFGDRLDPVTRSRIQNHKGIDLRAAIGTNVLSAFNGTVEEVGYENGGGNYVLVSHGSGIKTVYMHLESSLVKPGQKVKQYEVIALSGNTGARTTGPHLHFGVYINGEPVDPAVFVPH